MRILQRHILREFMIPVGYCFTAFISIFVLFDFIDKQSKIFAAQPPASVVFLYFASYVSTIVEYMLPASLLLGALYATWQLSRHSEIIAMKASGVSFRSIAAPMVAASVVFSLLLALNNEFLAPRALVYRRRVAANKFQPLPPYTRENFSYYNAGDGRSWVIGSFDVNHPEVLDDVHINFDGANHVRVAELASPRAEYLDGCWWFQTPRITHFNARGEVDQTVAPAPVRSVISRPDFSEQPRDFAIIANMSADKDMKLEQAFSLRDLLRYLKVHTWLSPEKANERRFDIWRRIASPWACLVITLFAVPAGVASGRQSVFRGVLMAIALFFGFYASSMIFEFCAKSGWIPAPLGAWAANIIFFVAALHVFRKQAM